MLNERMIYDLDWAAGCGYGLMNLSTKLLIVQILAMTYTWLSGQVHGYVTWCKHMNLLILAIGRSDQGQRSRLAPQLVLRDSFHRQLLAETSVLAKSN